MAALLQAAIWFGPFGWTVSGHRLRASDYVEAVALWEETADIALVDAYLTRAWNDDVWLRGSFGPMTTLARGDDAILGLLLARQELLDKALDHHSRAEFEASTLIVLSQIDGLTFDFTNGRFGFFYGAKDHFFEDDATLAGMPEFLKTVRKAVNRDVRQTTRSSSFQRGPIVHGRHLGFGTATNSTKAFALLSGVIEWLGPRADARAELTP